jgi:hypothetical protein
LHSKLVRELHRKIVGWRPVNLELPLFPHALSVPSARLGSQRVQPSFNCG